MHAALEHRPNLALTVDTEWFGRAHLVSAQDTSTSSSPKATLRDILAVDALIDLFDRHKVAATFFMVSDDFDASVVARIAAAGHEVASHSVTHPHFDRIDLLERRREIVDSKHALEAITGQAVHGFRAPSWSVSWDRRDEFHELVAEAGYRYSSSVCPYPTSLFGDRRFPDTPYRTIAGILEIPAPLLDRPAVPPGGSFFRALPPRLFRAALTRSNPAFFYVHPWETYPGIWNLRPSSFSPAAIGRHVADQAITNWGRRGLLARLDRLLSYLAPRFEIRPLRDVATDWT